MHLKSMFPSYRNLSFDIHYKKSNWFLFHGTLVLNGLTISGQGSYYIRRIVFSGGIKIRTLARNGLIQLRTGGLLPRLSPFKKNNKPEFTALTIS